VMQQIGVRGHATFGGRLTPDAKGFPASAMAKKHSGDWRDPAQVRDWAHTVAGELRTQSLFRTGRAVSPARVLTPRVAGPHTRLPR